MHKGIKFGIIGAIVIVVGASAFYLASPLFISTEIDEPLPEGSELSPSPPSDQFQEFTAMSEEERIEAGNQMNEQEKNQIMLEFAGMNTSIDESMGQGSETNDSLLTGPFVGVGDGIHDAQGLFKRKAILTTCMMGSVAATAILLAAILIPTYQASAQITPSSIQSSVLPENLQSAGGLLSQDLVDSVQNSTTSNITQLATVLPAVAQPITPLTAAPVTEETSDSDDENNASSNDNDDNGSRDDDNDRDDDSRDDDNDRDDDSRDDDNDRDDDSRDDDNDGDDDSRNDDNDGDDDSREDDNDGD